MIQSGEATQSVGSSDRKGSRLERLDWVFLAVLAGCAAVLRLVALSSLPDGLHGDEADAGLQAAHVLHSGNIGAYTTALHGTPTGPYYLMAPFVKVLGHDVIAVRLPIALLGVATVVLAFFTLRELYGRLAGYLGSFFLAFSSWFLFYNRTGLTATFEPFNELAALLALALALRKGTWPWYAAAGVVIGIGVYGYFAYPLFAFGLAIYVLIDAAARRLWRDPRIIRNTVVMGGTALLVALPILPYFTSTDRGFLHDRSVFSVKHSPQYQQATSTPQRIGVYRDNAVDVVASLVWDGSRDRASAAATVYPAMDYLTSVLAAVGIAYCLWYAAKRRDLRYALPIILIGFVILGPFWTYFDYQRRALGLVPLVVILAVLPVARAAEWAWTRRSLRSATVAAIVIGCSVYAAVNVHRYFWITRDAQAMNLLYQPELAEATAFMRQQPAGSKIYFASSSYLLDYPTIRYLAPNINAEDRSRTFGGSDAGFGDIDRTHGATIILMGRERLNADLVARLYPDAQRVEGKRQISQMPGFIAFEISPS